MKSLTPTARATVGVSRRQRAWTGLPRLLHKHGSLLLMMSPGLALLFAFSYVPLFGLVIAFKDYRAYQGIWGSAWVGVQNFQAGRDYVIVDKARNVIGFPKGLNAANDPYLPDTDWEFGNQFNAYYSSEKEVGAWDLKRRINETASLRSSVNPVLLQRIAVERDPQSRLPRQG